VRKPTKLTDSGGMSDRLNELAAPRTMARPVQHRAMPRPTPRAVPRAAPRPVSSPRALEPLAPLPPLRARPQPATPRPAWV
ncbi:MAG: hypothetical protein VXX04_07450, partial [Actinomycetota bacterium]|nr:hypothetical protein [Actinomycetota bacterium]